jgi:hypothetical protein
MPGKSSEEQVIGANVDIVAVVTDAGEDFNPRRMERYFTLIQRSGAQPVVPYTCTREWVPLSTAALHGRGVNGGIGVFRLDDEGVYPTFKTVGLVAAPPDAVLAALLDSKKQRRR